MRVLVLFDHPVGGSMSIQGQLLYQGLLANGIDAYACHYEERRREREWFYRALRPDAVIGIGWWVDTPTIVQEPQKFGLQPVPWLLADGWVANYHSILGALPLVLTTSRWVVETYARDGVDTKNFEVLHVGYDAELFKPIPRSNEGVAGVRDMFGVGAHEKMILTVGGDATSKGAQEMIRALAKIDKEYPHWKYVCKATESDDARDHHQEELKLIEEVGIDPSKVVYVEDDFYRDFMPYLLNAADIYAAPSRLEGFGMVQVEAMACGKPVISIDAMGPRDTVVHGKTGFLAKVASTVDLAEEWVYPEMGFATQLKMQFDKPKTLAYRADTAELAQFTLQLLVDDDMRETMGAQAAAHALAHFQYQHLARRCADILQRTLSL